MSDGRRALILTIWLAAATGAVSAQAQRAPVLQQVKVPHFSYYREISSPK